MSGKTISTSETKLEALSLQSSAYGVTIPLVYGMNRIAGNLIWYGGFKAIPNTSTSGGKGGGAKTQNTTFTYTASVMMGLCEGQISGVSRAWKGKTLFSNGTLPTTLTTTSETTTPTDGSTYTVTQAAGYSAPGSVTFSTGRTEDSVNYFFSEGVDYTRVGGAYTFPVGSKCVGLAVVISYSYATVGASKTSLQLVGLSFASGVIAQPAWAYLSSTFPAQAIGYNGLAYVYAQDYALGTGAQVDNHTFEIQGPQAYSVSASIPDANPASVTWDVLINGRYGAAFPSAQLGAVGVWSNYCLATGILMSPAVTTQMQAGEFVTTMGKLTNTAPVWSAGKLKMIPYGDAVLTGNGATYTPNTTPIYDLTDDDFLSSADPIKVHRVPQADAYNHIRLEFLDRGAYDATNRVWLGGYNITVAEAKDSANIDIYGLRSAAVIAAHWICDAAVARSVAQLILQRTLYVRNTFNFKLPWTKALLEPMDLVTLTDAGLGFVKLAARIVAISESDDGELDITAEEYPLGIANAALYATQLNAGYQHNYNAAPGSVAAPVIFESPGALTQNGLEICVAASSASPLWGGCRVWVSLNGTGYKSIGVINGGSRFGALTNSPAAGADIAVQLVTGALTSGSTADAAALNTLCYVGGANKEFIAFSTATFTAALNYALTGALRGLYGTASAAHGAGDPFVRLDTAVARSGPIDLGYIGQVIHVKLTSFNIYGAAEESLAAVTDYTYAVTGQFVQGNGAAAALAAITSIGSDSIISPGEKPALVQDYAVIIAERAGIDAQAVALGITAEQAAYDAAVAALTSYLAGLTGWNVIPGGNVAVVGATMRTTFENVYAAKQVLLNKIAAVAATVATWTGTTGTGKPADNASADLNLSGVIGVVVSGNSVTATAATTSTNGSFRSIDSYAGGAYCSYVLIAPTVATGGVLSNPVIGLSDSIGAGNASIRYGIHASTNGNLYKYESGTASIISASWSLGDVLGVSADGVTIRYSKNGAVIGTTAQTMSSTSAVYLNGQISDPSSVIKNLRFGPLVGINVGNLPNQSQGGALNDDPGMTDLTAWISYGPGTLSVVTLTDPAVGRTAFQCAGGQYNFQSRSIPVSPGKTYRASCYARYTVSGTNSLDMRLHCYNAIGSELAYNIGAEGVITKSGWVRYSGLMTPPAGSAIGVLSIDSNYAGTGTQQFQDVRIEEVINTDLISDNAATAMQAAISQSGSFSNGNNFTIQESAIFTSDLLWKNTEFVARSVEMMFCLSLAKTETATYSGNGVQAIFVYSIGTSPTTDFRFETPMQTTTAQSLLAAAYTVFIPAGMTISANIYASVFAGKEIVQANWNNAQLRITAIKK